MSTNRVTIAPNIDTQLSKITAIRDRSTFVAHPPVHNGMVSSERIAPQQNSRPSLRIAPSVSVGHLSSTLPPWRTATATRTTVFCLCCPYITTNQYGSLWVLVITNKCWQEKNGGCRRLSESLL